MLEPRGEQNFAIEAVGIDAGAELRREDFDHHAAVERRLERDEHARHAAAA